MFWTKTTIVLQYYEIIFLWVNQLSDWLPCWLNRRTEKYDPHKKILFFEVLKNNEAEKICCRNVCKIKK